MQKAGLLNTKKRYLAKSIQYPDFLGIFYLQKTYAKKGI